VANTDERKGPWLAALAEVKIYFYKGPFRDSVECW